MSDSPVVPAQSAVADTRAGLTIVLLALLLSIQPVTTDLYLPALPALTRDLSASVAAGQLTLSALLLAFGGSQLVWGPLSDRFGRRPVLLAGLAIYTAPMAAPCAVRQAISNAIDGAKALPSEATV